MSHWLGPVRRNAETQAVCTERLGIEAPLPVRPWRPAARRDPLRRCGGAGVVAGRCRTRAARHVRSRAAVPSGVREDGRVCSCWNRLGRVRIYCGVNLRVTLGLVMASRLEYKIMLPLLRSSSATVRKYLAHRPWRPKCPYGHAEILPCLKVRFNVDLGV